MSGADDFEAILDAINTREAVRRINRHWPPATDTHLEAVLAVLRRPEPGQPDHVAVLAQRRMRQWLNTLEDR